MKNLIQKYSAAVLSGAILALISAMIIMSVLFPQKTNASSVFSVGTGGRSSTAFTGIIHCGENTLLQTFGIAFDGSGVYGGVGYHLKIQGNLIGYATTTSGTALYNFITPFTHLGITCNDHLSWEIDSDSASNLRILYTSWNDGSYRFQPAYTPLTNAVYVSYLISTTYYLPGSILEFNDISTGGSGGGTSGSTTINIIGDNMLTTAWTCATGATATNCTATATSSLGLYNGPDFQEWLFVMTVIIFIVSFFFWPKISWVRIHKE